MKLDKNLTKGGPGDNSTPGNVNTSAWCVDLSEKTRATLDDPNKLSNFIKQPGVWFCDIPFTQVYSDMDGTYAACCFGAKQRKHTVNNTTMTDWMENSDYLNDIRKEMLDPNSKHEAVDKTCKRCRTDENKYGRSRRTNCLKIHTNDKRHWDFIQDAVELYKVSGMMAFDDRIFEIQLKIFGDQCNLDCHMCMHMNSSMRQTMAKKGLWNEAIFGDIDGSFERTKVAQKSNILTDDVIDEIAELAPYIRSIKIIGGEPLIMKKQYIMLDRLIETGHAPEIRLKFQTNLTKTSAGRHNLLTYIPKFQHVAIVVSADCHGIYNDYLRRKSSWVEIEENMKLCSQYPNAVVDINGLVSFLSVLKFYEIIDYCKGNDMIDQLNWAMLERPKHLKANNLPKPLKDKLIPKYKDWPDIVAALEMPNDPDVDIQEIFKYLLDQDSQYIGTKHEMHLFDVYPELKEYYIEN